MAELKANVMNDLDVFDLNNISAMDADNLRARAFHMADYRDAPFSPPLCTY